MGRYIDSALLPGEQIVAVGTPYWGMFVAPALVIGLPPILGYKSEITIT